EGGDFAPVFEGADDALEGEDGARAPGGSGGGEGAVDDAGFDGHPPDTMAMRASSSDSRMGRSGEAKSWFTARRPALAKGWGRGWWVWRGRRGGCWRRMGCRTGRARRWM